MEGGSVAVIAASRNASGADHDLFRGFIDCIWNTMLPAYPTAADGEVIRAEGSHRIGDALNYGKFYYASQWGHPDNPVQDRAICQRLFDVFNLLGDPTMEIWTACPYVDLPPMDLHPFEELRPLSPVSATYRFPLEIEGVIVTLIQKGKIIGQGISRNGQVKIQLDGPLASPDNISISFNKRGYPTQVRPFRIAGSVK